MKRFLTVTIICLCLVSVTGQAQESNPLEERIYAQLTAFPQEKIHVHTDKAVYVSGEKIWYRAFVVNALLHVPKYWKFEFMVYRSHLLVSGSRLSVT